MWIDHFDCSNEKKKPSKEKRRRKKNRLWKLFPHQVCLFVVCVCMCATAKIKMLWNFLRERQMWILVSSNITHKDPIILSNHQWKMRSYNSPHLTLFHMENRRFPFERRHHFMFEYEQVYVSYHLVPTVQKH